MAEKREKSDMTVEEAGRKGGEKTGQGFFNLDGSP